MPPRKAIGLCSRAKCPLLTERRSAAASSLKNPEASRLNHKVLSCRAMSSGHPLFVRSAFAFFAYRSPLRDGGHRERLAVSRAGLRASEPRRCHRYSRFPFKAGRHACGRLSTQAKPLGRATDDEDFGERSPVDLVAGGAVKRKPRAQQGLRPLVLPTFAGVAAAFLRFFVELSECRREGFRVLSQHSSLPYRVDLGHADSCRLGLGARRLFSGATKTRQGISTDSAQDRDARRR